MGAQARAAILLRERVPMRPIPLLTAFALGCAATWLLSRPAPPVPAVQTAPAAAIAAAGTVDVTLADVAPLADEPGIPPADFTLPRSHPSAGQRRALARALDGLERNPPAIEPSERTAEEVRAAVGAGLRAALNSPEGDHP